MSIDNLQENSRNVRLPLTHDKRRKPARIEVIRRYDPFFLVCLIGFATFFCSYLRIPVLPLFAASLGAGPAEVGMINGAFMLTTGLLSVPAGLLADRLGRRIPVIGGILAIAASSLLVSQCSSPEQMAGAYVLFGAGLAAFAPSMLSLVADTMPPEGLGRAYGWYTTGIYAAMTLGPAVGGLIGKSMGLRQVFYLSGLLLLVISAVAAFLLPESTARRKTEIHAIIMASTKLIGNRRLIACLVATVGICIGFGAFLSFLPLYAAGRGVGPGGAGFIFGVNGLANVVFRIPTGIVADKVDRRKIVTAGLFMFATGLSGIGIFGSLVGLAACAVLLGIGLALTFTALGALVAESVPPAQRGLAMGMFNSSIYLGLMTGSTMLGLLIHLIGYPAGFVAAATAAVVTLGVFIRLYGQVQDSMQD